MGAAWLHDAQQALTGQQGTAGHALQATEPQCIEGVPLTQKDMRTPRLPA